MDQNDQSQISEFPFGPLQAFKFNLFNCSFFHPSPNSLDQIRSILKEDGDFLIQDSKGTKLILTVRLNSKIFEFSISIVQKGGPALKFEFAKNVFDSLEDLAIFFSKKKGNYIVTECGEHFHLCRPIYRQNHSGRFGYGKCMDLRDTIQPNKIHPSFVRSLRPEFAESNEIVEGLEKLIKLDHRNLIRVRDFFILPSICTNSPLIFVRFDQIQGCQALFDRLFNQNGPLNSSRQYIKWAYQAGKGLNYLMERAILHHRLNARSCLLDSLQNLRLSDFWTENDPGDFALFQSKNNHLANSTKSTAILYKDGWRYLPPETLLNGQFDSVSQVWSYSLLIWQIFTHCQFAGNRIFYSSLAEFLTITSGRDDPFYLPGHLDEKEAQKGMPEDRRRKQIFLHASHRLPHPPDSIAQIIPEALHPDRPQRPFFSQLFRVIEAEKRILDLANVFGFLL